LIFIKEVIKRDILKFLHLVLGIRCMEFYLYYSYAPTATYVINQGGLFNHTKGRVGKLEMQTKKKNGNYSKEDF